MPKPLETRQFTYEEKKEVPHSRICYSTRRHVPDGYACRSPPPREAFGVPVDVNGYKLKSLVRRRKETGQRKHPRLYEVWQYVSPRSGIRRHDRKKRGQTHNRGTRRGYASIAVVMELYNDFQTAVRRADEMVVTGQSRLPAAL
ncbi:MAG: hypothetical protein HYY37_01880 [Candidatus Aenigmarchaeota archaeon]|nr:hypothetical protein [Candidatus Aenigmarchaeota archaeon]